MWIEAFWACLQNIRNYLLSVLSQRKYTFYHQNTLLNAVRTNSRNIIGRNSSMVIPLLANQHLTPILPELQPSMRSYYNQEQNGKWENLATESKTYFFQNLASQND